MIARRYEVVRRLGAGGMGVVYEARDRQLGGERLALKCLAPHACHAPDSVERLRREVRLAQRVTHPNVCRVHDLVEAGRNYYLSMEFIEGSTLADWLAAQPGRRLTPQDALPVLLQVLDGVAAIHAVGIVHRDLKPHNVIVAADGRARVMDFGVALAPDLAQLSAPGALLGTLAYMSPEQWRGEPLDARADIYALGVILYETFTGRRPFAGDLQALMHQHLNVPPVDPRQYVPDLTANLSSVVLYCLKKRAEERLESALGLRQALEDAVNDPYRHVPAPDPTTATLPSPAAAPPPAPAAGWHVGGNVGNAGNVSGNGNNLGSIDNAVHNSGNGVVGSGNAIGNHALHAGGSIQTLGDVHAGGPVNFGNGVIHAGGNTQAGGSVVTTNIHNASAAGGGSAGLGVVAGGALAILAVVVVALLAGLGYFVWLRSQPPAPGASASLVSNVATPSVRPNASGRGPTAAPAPTLTPDRSVHVTCAGAAEVCATLEATLVEDLAQKGIRAVPVRDSAHARVTLRATLTGTREETVHDSPLTIRQYAVQAEATLARSGTRVLLPSGTLQADTLVGAEALEERARAQALSISDALDAAVGR